MAESYSKKTRVKKMNKKDDTKKYKRQVAKIFASECYVCGKKYGKNFQFHHIRYREDTKTCRDFTTNVAYQSYILPIIHDTPWDFELLCNKHHYLIEQLKRFKPERLERLFAVTRRSIF